MIFRRFADDLLDRAIDAGIDLVRAGVLEYVPALLWLIVVVALLW